MIQDCLLFSQLLLSVYIKETTGNIPRPPSPLLRKAEYNGNVNFVCDDLKDRIFINFLFYSFNDLLHSFSVYIIIFQFKNRRYDVHTKIQIVNTELVDQVLNLTLICKINVKQFTRVWLLGTLSNILYT